MAKKTKKQEKTKKVTAAAAKKGAPKAKLAAKKKAAPRKKKIAPKKKRAATAPAVMAQNQEVQTVRLRPKARAAKAGAGGGDFGGASVVEDVDSESVDELLEEGQTLEAGIVKGVEAANEPGEVHTHEVLQDDVPQEYEDKD